MSATYPAAAEQKWSLEHAADLSPLEALAYRSNLLGSNRAIANFGGGNTSAKLREIDHVGREIDVSVGQGLGERPRHDSRRRLYRATAGGDPPAGRPRRDERRGDGRIPGALSAHARDASRLDRDAAARVHPCRARRPHASGHHRCNRRRRRRGTSGRGVLRIGGTLDSLHPPGVRVVQARRRGRGRATRCQVRAPCETRPRHVGRYAGDVLRGDSRGGEPRQPSPRGGGTAPRPRHRRPSGSTRRVATSCSLRFSGASRSRLERRAADPPAGHLAGRGRLRFQRRRRGALQIGAACPDHLVHTKRRPLWVDFDAEVDDAEALRVRLADGVRAFQRREQAYFEQTGRPRTDCSIRAPRVVLVQGVGMVSVGRT